CTPTGRARYLRSRIPQLHTRKAHDPQATFRLGGQTDERLGKPCWGCGCDSRGDEKLGSLPQQIHVVRRATDSARKKIYARRGSERTAFIGPSAVRLIT